LIGLPYAAYIVWQNRKKWQRLEDRSHPLGAFSVNPRSDFLSPRFLSLG
jgi:hypothetical protein